MHADVEGDDGKGEHEQGRRPELSGDAPVLLLQEAARVARFFSRSARPPDREKGLSHDMDGLQRSTSEITHNHNFLCHYEQRTGTEPGSGAVISINKLTARTLIAPP